MTDTATVTPAPALTVVLEEATDGFAPRTRKSTADALSSLKPSLDAVQAAPGKVYTIVKDITPAKAASLVSLLNERHDTRWTFGGRTSDDGSAIVQARFSADPALARPVRVSKPRKPPVVGTTGATAPKGGKK